MVGNMLLDDRRHEEETVVIAEVLSYLDSWETLGLDESL